MSLIVLCWALHFSDHVEVECHVTRAPSAHAAAMALIRRTPETSRQWDVVWHTTTGNLAVIHYCHETDENECE